MQLLKRGVLVDGAIRVSSEWALPAGHRAAVRSCVILAHGAGSDMHDPLLSFVHRTLAEHGIPAVKFNFPYKELGRKAPDPMPRLEATWRAVLREVRNDARIGPTRMVIGGRSMGGRVASHIAAQGDGGDALLFLGYPLHPAGKPEQMRAEHLPRLRCPLLFVQGTRDALCDMARLDAVLATLRSGFRLHRVEGGDHAFRVLRRLRRDENEVWGEIASVVVGWVRSLDRPA